MPKGKRGKSTKGSKGGKSRADPKEAEKSKYFM